MDPVASPEASVEEPAPEATVDVEESEEDQIRRSVQLYVEELMNQISPEHEFELESLDGGDQAKTYAEVSSASKVKPAPNAEPRAFSRMKSGTTSQFGRSEASSPSRATVAPPGTDLRRAQSRDAIKSGAASPSTTMMPISSRNREEQEELRREKRNSRLEEYKAKREGSPPPLRSGVGAPGHSQTQSGNSTTFSSIAP